MNKVLVVVTLDDTGHDNKMLWDNFCDIGSVKQHNEEWAFISLIKGYTILFVRQTGDDSIDDMTNRTLKSIKSIKNISHLSISYHKGSLDEKRLKKEITIRDLILPVSFVHDSYNPRWKLIAELIDTLKANGKNIEHLIKKFFDASILKDDIFILKYKLLSLWYPIAVTISALKADIQLDKIDGQLKQVDVTLLDKSKQLLVEGDESLLKYTNDENKKDFKDKILPLFGVVQYPGGSYEIQGDSYIKMYIEEKKPENLLKPWSDGWKAYSNAKEVFTFHEWMVLVDDLIDEIFDLVESE